MSGPEPTWPSVQPRARPRRRSSAASSDTSPVRSTGSSLPRPHIAPRFQGLDEHRSICETHSSGATRWEQSLLTAPVRIAVQSSVVGDWEPTTSAGFDRVDLGVGSGDVVAISYALTGRRV